MDVTIGKARKIRGTLAVPGDKSIAHRALILGALAEGGRTVSGLPASADVASTIACLRVLGCSLAGEAGGTMRVTPPARPRGGLLDAGNSGTTARLIAGLAAGLGLRCIIGGDRSLRRRPMKRIAEPLALMGAGVETAPGGGLPLEIRGAPLEGIIFRPAAASAQVKSCVLIAGLRAAGETTVVEKAPTRDHTEIMLAAMGVPVTRRGTAVTVPGGARLEGVPAAVPGDFSSAAFFMAAAALLPGSEVRLEAVGVNPTRTGALDVLEKMGAQIFVDRVEERAGEKVADIAVRSAPLHGTTIGGDIVPRLIDELPVLAVAAALAEGETVVSGAFELRRKESDRIRAIVVNLSRLGAAIEERDDGFVVRGPAALEGAVVDAFGDHRMAMAMAVAGLAASGRTRIRGAGCAAVSYPGFFDDLGKLLR